MQLIQSLFGGGNNQSNLPPTLDVFGGGTNAPFTFGVNQFDLQSIVDAFHKNMGATQARYNQLGLGGSSMEAQDLGTAPSLTGGLPQQEKAVIGQEQTQNVGNAALNPALQPQIDAQLGGGGATGSTGSSASSLGQLAGAAGNLLGGLGGGTAAADAGTEAAIGSLGGDVAEGLAILG
jgi:hypothetical protein